MKTSFRDIFYLVTDGLIAVGLVFLIGIAHIAIKVGRTAARYQKLLKEWISSIHNCLELLAASLICYDNPLLSGLLTELI